MKRYWMVHFPGTATRVLYPSLDAAIAEAKRLHRQTGDSFVVLESVGVVVGPDELPTMSCVPNRNDSAAQDLPY